MSQVIIAGSGPTGLMLAGELALAGIEVVIVERRSTPELVGSRAGGLYSRTLEILDQRGIVERFFAEGGPLRTSYLVGADGGRIAVRRGGSLATALISLKTPRAGSGPVSAAGPELASSSLHGGVITAGAGALLFVRSRRSRAA